MRDVLRRLTGVQGRAAAVATLLVAATIVPASVAFVVAQRHQLSSSAASLALQEATDKARELSNGTSTGTDLTGATSEQSLLQIVTDDGTVEAASLPQLRTTPMVSPVPRADGGTTGRVRRLTIGEDESFVVAAVRVQAPEGARTVLAARSLESVGETTRVAVVLLAAGLPIFLAFVFAISWWLTRRTLRPVERMRRHVGRLTATDLRGRVPVPRGDDDVTALASTMNDMLDRLEASAATQRQFVSDASHELRSPLTTIRSLHEVAAAHPGTQDVAALSADVVAELDVLEHLVDDLLYLARIDEKVTPMRSEDVDLDDLVRAEMDRLSRGGLVTVTGTTDHVRLTGDAAGWTRVLRNLGDNAARHAHSSVEIRLTAHPARLTVHDDGDGVPLERRGDVFERFVRLDDSRTRGSGGSGLGLAIVRTIVEAHGGTVGITGPAGAGTSVVISLPGQP